MKTKILFTILSLCAALFTSCIEGADTGSSTGNMGTTVSLYELNVNDATWTFYDSKITLTDNAKKNPASYEYDYTLTLRAADASNMINAESKILTFNFDAEDIEELVNTNLGNCENFHLTYRSKMETRASTYNYEGGMITISKIENKVATIVFNRLKMKAAGNNTLLPELNNKEIVISGEIKCGL